MLLPTLLCENPSRLVSDEPVILVLAQADCPRVIVIFTAVLFAPVEFPASRQFRVEEFPASSEVFVPIMNTDIIIGSNCILRSIKPFTVHPVPAPCSTKALANSKINEGGSSQKEMLFNRGKAISGAPICTGTK